MMQPETTRPYLKHSEDTRTRFGLDSGGVGHDVADEGTSSSCLRTRRAERCSHTGKSLAMSRPWTPAEKNAFFRALSVYSRWRPDLIAAAVHTCSVWEVDLYLAALEEGAERIFSDFGFEEGDSASDLELGFAYEVSDAWVAAEETLASHIIREDNSALLERYRNSFVPRKRDGTNAKRPYRRLGAKRVTSYADAKLQESVDSQQPSDTQVDRSSVTPQAQTLSSNEPPAKRPRVEQREEYLACLGDAHLSALDSILRDAEESLRMEGSCKEKANANDPSNAMIDPVLLAISGVPINTITTMPSIPIKGIAATERSALVSSSPPLTKVAVTHDDARRDTVNLAHSRVRAASEDPAALNPDLLSPKSRRRLQKRLYMRRRRAKSQGREEAFYSTTEVESADIGQLVGLRRLKPGRKAKDKKPTKVKQNARGLTLRPKLKAIFSKLDIDATYLRAQGMDLLQFECTGAVDAVCIASYAGHRQTIKALDGIEDEVPFTIDGTLIRHLQAAVVFFVTDVIYRAIAWKEGQIRLKQGSRAWRSSDQRLTPSAIKHAIEYVGFYDEGGCEHGDPAVPGVSTHRDLFMPFIRPPSALGVHLLDCFSRTYMREATRRADREEGEQEADWMSSETDEEALEAELREDEALDEEDMDSAAEYEEMLWETIGDTPASFL
ncbi:hypothetical protein EDD15DRAFT_2290363 [Pisolithus albus]|nr:hypothetical protein EDD15DRAFT_2290363 [Pisolithus albus]